MKSYTYPSMVLIVVLFSLGCYNIHSGQGQVISESVEHSRTVMFFSIQTDAKQDPHSVIMALQLAGHAMDDGRPVVLFFNVRGVSIPTNNFPADLNFHGGPSVKALLDGLMARGAQVHVCPHCMEAMNVTEAELIAGAKVTNREELFKWLGPDTVVFTY